MNPSPAVVQLKYFQDLLAEGKEDGSGTSLSTDQIRCALAHAFLLKTLYRSSVERTLALDQEIALTNTANRKLRQQSRELRVKDIKTRRKIDKPPLGPPLVTDLLRRPETLLKLGLDGRKGEKLSENIALDLTIKLAKLQHRVADSVADNTDLRKVKFTG